MNKFFNFIFDLFYFLIFYIGTYHAELLAKKPENNDKLLKLMRKRADIILKIHKAEKKESIKDIVLEWKRMFPFCNKLQKIKNIKNDTAYIETHFKCPFHGSNNVYGCYLAMEFDRRILEKIGGQFVVLYSQAEKDVDICEVVIRKKGMSMTDLVPAHKRKNN